MPRPSDPSFVAVRLKGHGPIGYLDVERPCSLAQLRTILLQEGAVALPHSSNGNFRFLTAGVPVSLPQEESEQYQEGDIFIASLPSEVAAKSAPADAASDDLPSASAPPFDFVLQWVDAFDFMCGSMRLEERGARAIVSRRCVLCIAGRAGVLMSRSRPSASSG